MTEAKVEGVKVLKAEAKRLNLPLGYWYEIWSQVIARAWSALVEVEQAVVKGGRIKVPPADLLSWLSSDEGQAEWRHLVDSRAINPETINLLSGLPAAAGENGRKEIDWAFLKSREFVAGEEPLNFPKLHLELLKDGEKDSEAKYMVKNAFRNINGWAQDLVELGGKATIKVPDPNYHLDERQRARALDWYVKQGFYMPFAPNNYGPFSTASAVTPDIALGFSGGRVGEETVADGQNGDAAWAAVFPQILAAVWHDDEQRERLVQAKAKANLKAITAGGPENEREIRKIRERMSRERDALFAQFGYGRPAGLEIDFELARANYTDAKGWDGSALQPELVVRIPPPPRNIGLHPIALADYRATGKAQLFTT
jgi:hypothetical protein